MPNSKLRQIQVGSEVYDIQADSVENQNHATGALSDKFDWIGTQSEYIDQDIENQHPDWFCYITDDVTSDSGEIDLSNYAKTTDLLEALYPIGSVYTSRVNTNPLETLLPNSTWTQISTTMITSVDTSAAVKGNGKTLGLTNGSSNYGLYCNMGVYGAMFPTANGYGSNAGSGASYNQLSVTLGVTTDASQSGMVANVNRNSINLYMWERIA